MPVVGNQSLLSRRAFVIKPTPNKRTQDRPQRRTLFKKKRGKTDHGRSSKAFPHSLVSQFSDTLSQSNRLKSRPQVKDYSNRPG